MKIHAGSYEKDSKDTDLVIITAGAAQKKGGETRTELLTRNAKIVKEIVENLVNNGFQGIFLMVTNPVDVLSYLVMEYSGFPSHKVIGSGTVLDSARLKYNIANRLGISPKSVHAYQVGEHGDSEFALWSNANIGGQPITDLISASELKNIETDTKNQAYEIINKKGATYYGIAVALARITKAILDDENAVLPLSVFQEGQYGVENVFIGQPAIVGAHGIVRPVNIPLNDAETQKMQLSARELQEIIDEAWKNPEFQAASKN